MIPAGKTGDELPGWIRSIHPNEETILKDTKNTIEETVEKIKETVRENPLSCILMIGFVLLFCVLSGPEIAQEAASRHVLSDGAKEQQSEPAQSETESEMAQTEETAKETEIESETETEPAMTPKRMRQLRARYGKRFHIPMLTPYEDTEAMLYLELPERFRLRGYTLPEIKPEKTMAGLEQELAGQLSEYEGEWSVYVKNLSTDEAFVLNDQPMKSASVMKLFIMGTVYKAFECGELERTEEIMSLMNKMISYSDNASSNELLSRLGNGSYADGIEKVNAFIKEYGFSDMTMEYNGFDDSETIMDSEHFNQVTAKDCGKLLEDIYRRTWVSRGISNEIEDMLLAQQTRYKIPAGLPEGVLCGNKTGEMDATENDAAIIYAKDCDYILVVLSNDWSSKDQAITRIQLVSSMVYDYLNGDENGQEE